MKKTNSHSIQIVVERKICCGCGACPVVCPNSCIEFVYGNRFNYPKIDVDRCVQCGKCLKVCPSAFLLDGIDPGFSNETAKASNDCYLIHSRDDDVRLGSSSGGFITGMILHLMGRGLVDGGVVARSSSEYPLVSESLIAMDREALLSARGSRYAPVSNCIKLGEVLHRAGRYVFVGTPCMVEALTKLQELLPKLKKRIVLSIGLVCSGMASNLSTKAYIKQCGVEPRDVRCVCYRGDGWPGSFRIYGDNGFILERPYNDELTRLICRDHYLRCWNCLDHWAKWADITVSDPWCNEMVKTERKGKSAIMVRTERGKEAVASAIENGELIAESIAFEDMLGYNKNLVIDSNHPRHAWMALYQLFFWGRLKNPIPIFRNLLNKKGIGLLTTLKARFTKDYYESEIRIK